MGALGFDGERCFGCRVYGVCGVHVLFLTGCDGCEWSVFGECEGV